MSSTDDRAEALMEYAIARPDGFTNEEAMRQFGWTSLRHFNSACRRVRLIYGGDSMNLVCEPQGQRERWRYRLVGNVAEARTWFRNRIEDMEARIETMAAEASSYVHASDGRSLEGRKARYLATVLASVTEQLALMGDSQGRLWE